MPVHPLWLVRASNTALRMLRKCAAAPAGVLHSVACVGMIAAPCWAPLPSNPPSSSTGCKRKTCCPLEACSRFLLGNTTAVTFRCKGRRARSTHACSSLCTRSIAAFQHNSAVKRHAHRGVSHDLCALAARLHSPASCGSQQSWLSVQRQASHSLGGSSDKVTSCHWLAVPAPVLPR